MTDEQIVEQYIEWVRKLTGPDVMHIVPDTQFYNLLKQRRPDLKLVIKGSMEQKGMDELVLKAIEKAKTNK